MVGAGAPSLRTAQYRVIQAGRRARELVNLIGDMQTAAEARPVRITFPRDQLANPDMIEPRVEWDGTFKIERLLDARMLASEVIHHLRTALEYLAFELVWLDSGKPHEKSQFPMCHKSREWEDALKRQVPGLTPEHQQVLKKLQPFRHCRWTTRLQELSNVDKHRYVLSMNTSMWGTFRWSPRDALPDPSDPSRCLIEVQGEPLVIEMAGGGDAVSTLESLCTSTAQLLNSLVADFGETNKLVLSALKPPPEV